MAPGYQMIILPSDLQVWQGVSLGFVPAADGIFRLWQQRPSGIVELPDVHRSSNFDPNDGNPACRVWVEW